LRLIEVKSSRLFEYRGISLKIRKLASIILSLCLMAASLGCATLNIASSAPMANGTYQLHITPPAYNSDQEGGSTKKDKAINLFVFAAASLNLPFTEIGKAFESANPGVTIVYNFAGSQQLAQQINQGAPADVFASANTIQMANVISQGQIISGTQQLFAKNRLVAILPAANPGSLSRLQDLAKTGLKVILADPSVPVGHYTLEFLDLADKDPTFGPNFKKNVLKNVVSYENDVKSVLAKVMLGEGDAGIVYTTDAAGAAPGKVSQIEIPDGLNVIATYWIAPVKVSQNPEVASKFINYVLSPDGQRTLAKYGFIPVNK
jgi:molybdate transport system substrate-binding protein